MIAKSTEYDFQNNGQVGNDFERIRLYYNGYTVVLVKEDVGNKWLLTGWENKKEATAFATGEVNDSSGATAANPTRTRIDGVDAYASDSSITQPEENSQGQKQYRSSSMPSDIDILIEASEDVYSKAVTEQNYAVKFIYITNKFAFIHNIKNSRP